MRKIILLSSLILLTCSGPSDRRSELFYEIKRLEYKRISNWDQWQNIVNDPDHAAFKHDIVKSMGRLRSPNFIPYLAESALNASTEDLRAEALFALGQIGTPQAEQSLLNMPFNEFAVLSQKNLIKALGQCATQKTVSFLNEKLSSEILSETIFETAAICARNRLDVTPILIRLMADSLKQKATHQEAYFACYASSVRDLGSLIRYTRQTDGIAQRYVLKAINRILETKPAGIQEVDSMLSKQLKEFLFTNLKQNQEWQNIIYTLKISAVLGDSTFFPVLESLSKNNNNHVTLQAQQTIADLMREQATSFLLASFEKSDDWYEKGHLIKQLARVNPKLGYRFIMQYLDKGSHTFKALLIDALAILSTPEATKMLQQFVQVAERPLANRAFENLIRLNRARPADYAAMLKSGSGSSVATALTGLQQQKKMLTFSELVNLYMEFNHPSTLETQMVILESINTPGAELNPDRLLSLWNYACHNYVRQKIRIDFSSMLPDSLRQVALEYGLPSFLQADSIDYSEQKITIDIETSRGKMKAELFPEHAPLTVQNFINLAQNGFYSDLIFHRVIADFVVQTGDPTGDGWGGPDYIIPSEDNNLAFRRGSIGMATAGTDTGGSQFFICHSEQPHLDGRYTLFGQVIDELDILDQILPGDRLISVKMSQHN